MCIQRDPRARGAERYGHTEVRPTATDAGISSLWFSRPSLQGLPCVTVSGTSRGRKAPAIPRIRTGPRPSQHGEAAAAVAGATPTLSALGRSQQSQAVCLSPSPVRPPCSMSPEVPRKVLWLLQDTPCVHTPLSAWHSLHDGGPSSGSVNSSHCNCSR